MVVKQGSSRKRREEVLDAAASVMARLGVNATRLQDVADALGISYNGLYYYFDNGDELTAAVLCRTIEQRRSHLLETQGKSAFDKIMKFIAEDLTNAQRHAVAMPLTALMEAGHSQDVRKARNALLEDFAQLVTDGVDEGSIKPCHSPTIANVCLRILENPNLLTQQPDMSNNEIAQHVVRQLSTGVLRIPTSLIATKIIEQGAGLLGTAPELDPDLTRLDAIYRVATRHFNSQGGQLSIPKIAAEMGVSKTVIYNFFVDKKDLIYRCLSRGIQVVETSNRFASLVGVSPLDEMLIHRANLYRFHASEAGPFTLVNSLHVFTPQHARQLRLRNTGLRLTSETRVRRAIQSGELLGDLNSQVTQFLFGITLYGLPLWYSADYDLSIDEVIDQTAILLFTGLSTANTSPA